MLDFFEYELPFRSTFRGGTSEFDSRKGVLIRYQKENIDLVAEASPLPGFSKETLDEVKQVLLDQKSKIEEFFNEDLAFQTIRKLGSYQSLQAPSIQFALSFLGLSILAKQQKKTIYDLFGKKIPDKIYINDIVGDSAPDELKKNIELSIKKEFKVIKIKAPHPIDELSILLKTIHMKNPEIQFRLDANQSWPQSEFRKNCNRLQGLPIKYIEEPCKIENSSDIKEILNTSSIPIALDESISSIEFLKKVLRQFPDIVVIIKPMLLGNFLEIYETISQFRSSFKHIVVTTTLESRIGRSMIASTASLIGDQKMSHGLHTGHLFADDLLADFEIENGSIINLNDNLINKPFEYIKTSYLKKLR